MSWPSAPLNLRTSPPPPPNTPRCPRLPAEPTRSSAPSPLTCRASRPVPSRTITSPRTITAPSLPSAPTKSWALALLKCRTPRPAPSLTLSWPVTPSIEMRLTEKGSDGVVRGPGGRPCGAAWVVRLRWPLPTLIFEPSPSSRITECPAPSWISTSPVNCSIATPLASKPAAAAGGPRAVGHLPPEPTGPLRPGQGSELGVGRAGIEPATLGLKVRAKPRKQTVAS